MKKLSIIALALLLSAQAFAEVTVTAVKGAVGVMEAKKLSPVSVGMKLKDDATVVTGANSEVTMAVNNGVITLKSLTTARLSGVAVSPTTSTAAVALKSGTVVSEVKQIQGLKTSFTVTTPVGTSSVRGTSHTVSFSQERGMEIAVQTGIVAVSSARGGTRPVAAGASYVQAASAAPPQVSTQTSQAAQEAARPSAAAVFAPPEEAAVAAASGGGGAEPSPLAGLTALMPVASTTGTVTINLVFP
jgi:hypothetical protein